MMSFIMVSGGIAWGIVICTIVFLIENADEEENDE